MKHPIPPCFAATLALAIALLGARPVSAAAYSLGIDITGNTSAIYIGSPGVVGWSFQATAPLLLYGIGFFDPVSQPTLGTPVTVGLWDGGGNLLVSGTVTGTATDVVVPSTDCCGEWLFLTPGIPILTLSPGTYVMGALIPENTQTTIVDALTAPTFPGITFLNNLQGSGLGGLVEPTITLPGFGLGFFGPNLLVSAAPTSAPEPAPSVLIAGALALCALLFRRKPSGVYLIPRNRTESTSTWKT